MVLLLQRFVVHDYHAASLPHLSYHLFTITHHFHYGLTQFQFSASCTRNQEKGLGCLLRQAARSICMRAPARAAVQPTKEQGTRELLTRLFVFSIYSVVVLKLPSGSLRA